MKKSKHQPYIFSVYAEDKKGLIGQLMIYFNRKDYPVESINVARTDISDLVLITIEAALPGSELLPFAHRLEKIIEVYSVQHQAAGGGLKKVGFYRLQRSALNDSLWMLMQKYGASLSTIGEKSLVISKTGSDNDLLELYTQLEGPELIGFCKSALVADDALNYNYAESSLLLCTTNLTLI